MFLNKNDTIVLIYIYSADKKYNTMLQPDKQKH